MPLRNSMAALILLVRDKVGDPNASVFSDQQVQDALDRTREEHRWALLRNVPSFLPGGAVQYKDFYSAAQYWEDDALLQDMNFNAIASDPLNVYEPIAGHWYLNTQPSGFAVRITGKTYDIFAASADLLEGQASQQMLQFSFSTGRDTFNRNQKFDNILKLAASYRAQALPHTVTMAQSDESIDSGSNAVTYPSQSEGYGT